MLVGTLKTPSYCLPASIAPIKAYFMPLHLMGIFSFGCFRMFSVFSFHQVYYEVPKCDFL